MCTFFNLVKIRLRNFKAGIKRLWGRNIWTVDIFLKVIKDRAPNIKNYLLAEFSVTFGAFRDTLCEVYLECRDELTPIWLHSLTYESHKSFCVMYRKIQSETDLSLISRRLAHHKTLACSICSSFSYTVSPCTRSVIPKLSHQLKMISVPF